MVEWADAEGNSRTVASSRRRHTDGNAEQAGVIRDAPCETSLILSRICKRTTFKAIDCKRPRRSFKAASMPVVLIFKLSGGFPRSEFLFS